MIGYILTNRANFRSATYGLRIKSQAVDSTTIAYATSKSAFENATVNSVVVRVLMRNYKRIEGSDRFVCGKYTPLELMAAEHPTYNLRKLKLLMKLRTELRPYCTYLICKSKWGPKDHSLFASLDSSVEIDALKKRFSYVQGA